MVGQRDPGEMDVYVPGGEEMETGESRLFRNSMRAHRHFSGRVNAEKDIRAGAREGKKSY